jgi:hypothetical protein
MNRLIFLLLLVIAGWYGWKHGPALFKRTASHDAVVLNATGMTMERVRVTVDGQTFVKEVIDNEQSAVFPFKVAHDASFQLEWEWKDKLGERRWRGGMVPRGPMVQRHLMQVDADGGVVYTASVK